MPVICNINSNSILISLLWFLTAELYSLQMTVYFRPKNSLTKSKKLRTYDKKSYNTFNAFILEDSYNL